MLKVPPTLWLSVMMIPMQATNIRASMTAYSTAVGPSSLVRKRVTGNRGMYAQHGSSFLRQASILF